MKLTLTTLVALVCLANVSRADVVTLKNGDRVTGTLITVKGGTLQLKSDIMGAVSIPMDKVASYSVTKPVALITKGKEPIQGTVEMKPSGEWAVTEDGKTRIIPAANVDTIMPATDYQKLVVVAPRFWQAWKGSASLGESIQRGNQDTNTIATTITATRERPAAPIFQAHSRTNFGATALLSHANETVGDTSTSITSHTVSGNLREDYLFTPNNFVFGMAQVDHISTEGLYMRQTYGGGFGKDVLKNSKTTFSLIGGLTFQHQKFINGTFDQSADGLFGEKLGEQFTKRIRLDHNLNFYPNFTQGGEYRFDTTTSLSIKLLGRLNFNTNLIDLYLSNPPMGSQKNNVTFSTGIGYSF